MGGQLRPLLPNQKVYFVHEPDSVKAAKLALYLNHPIAEAFVRLVASKLANGYVDHISSTVGHLPAPSGFFSPWKTFEKQLSAQQPDQVNQFLSGLSNSSLAAIDKKIQKSVGSISELVKYSAWLSAA